MSNNTKTDSNALLFGSSSTGAAASCLHSIVSHKAFTTSGLPAYSSSSLPNSSAPVYHPKWRVQMQMQTNATRVQRVFKQNPYALKAQQGAFNYRVASQQPPNPPPAPQNITSQNLRKVKLPIQFSMINQVGQKDQKRAKKFEPQQCIRSYTNPYVGGTRKYNLRSTPSFNQLHSSSAQVVVVLPHGATAVVQAPPNIDQTKKMKTHNKQKKKDYSVIPDEFFVSWHPSALIVNPKFQELSRIHQDIFTKSRNTFSQRITFFNNLRGALTSNFPNMRFHVTGSSVTGVIFYDGDLDITVLPLSQQRFPADAILRTLKPVLSKCLGNERVVFIKARVPILKVDTLSALCPFPVDISFGSAMGIQGCYYLRRLLDMHSNARPLALLIKHWAFRVGILDSQRCLLSSHSILLMVIFYLQTVGILPMQDPTNTCDGLEIPIAPDPVDEPHLSIELCELFIGLLHFYSVFPFPSRCISVRQTNKTLPETSDCIRIQDPIDPMFNVARNVKSANMLQITEAFRTALHSWKPTMGY